MRILMLVAGSLLLSGCFRTTIVKEPIEVYIPVPVCPAPPAVPRCDYNVDSLTSADTQDPGKVGQAYKADMMCLRARERVIDTVLQQYDDLSKTAESIKDQVMNLPNTPPAQ